MSVVANVARNLRYAYRQEGAAGVLAATRYYAARAYAAVVGPGRECPVCGWSGRDFHPLFLLHDRYVRRGAVCPGCHSYERQRAFVPALRELLEREIGDRKVDVLEFSPDAQVAHVLRGFARTYRGSNYHDPAPDELQLDLHHLSLPHESVDLAVMTYVLCCVPEDVRATRGLWYVLRPGGMVVACEGFSTTGSHQELSAAGHGGTWRGYGVGDVAQRFAPFVVDVVDLTGRFSESERRRRGLRHPEYMLLLRKPDTARSRTDRAGMLTASESL